MKKMFCFMLVISVLLLSACQSAQPVTTVDSNTETEAGTHQGIPGVGGGFSGGSGSVMPSFKTVEEYEKWFSEHPGVLTEDFIPYDTISASGELVLLILNRYESDGTCESYTYSVQDENKCEYQIGIDHTREFYSIEEGKEVSVPSSMEDMLNHPSKDKCYLVHNGVTYGYRKGHIAYVMWETDKCTVYLYFTFSTDPQITDPDSFLAKLLSKDAADVQEALEMISMPLANGN